MIFIRQEGSAIKGNSFLREPTVVRFAFMRSWRCRWLMELKEVGLDVGEPRIGSLMKINGIKPVCTRERKVTTDKRHRLDVAVNWLDGDFAADASGCKWVGDIT